MNRLNVPVALAASLSFLLCACPSGQSTVSGEEQGGEKAAEAAAEAPAAEKPTAEKPEAPPAARPAPPIGDLPAPPDVAAPPADAEKTQSGLASKVLTAGTGKEHPTATDIVKVHYTGWQTDGKMFDSSVKRGQPTSFPLNRVIAGWTEGVQLMVEGEKRRFWIPQELAYQGRPGPPAGMLVFDVELIAIITPKTPADVAAAPADAQKTDSGLASKVISAGTGTVHPTAESVVQVDYSGWTTDGKMFDSSVTRGRPATFPLNGVIAGWTEGVQLMVEGETRRLWIPQELAYQGKPGAPAGMLVFDVTLIKILK
ncbi:MAG: FKBP-type peptidyl-prolyl cis-trans isomerase [Deltaproteobacteria bacterium]|nr:FKBP-type peptidyl-prolyl cis-trans isomerase [Deltaproteobacteria bacterium]